jgi:hypothetical protein
LLTCSTLCASLAHCFSTLPLLADQQLGRPRRKQHGTVRAHWTPFAPRHALTRSLRTVLSTLPLLIY